MTPARFRKLALALEGVTEVPHVDRAAFRTKRKIFATLKGRGLNLLVEPEEHREALLATFPEVVSSLGGWSRLGWLAIDLTAVSDELLTELLADAHRAALPSRPARPKASAAKAAPARRSPRR